MTDFGHELRQLLADRRMSLREAARLAGCSPGYLSNVAHGRKPLTPSLASRLDRVLGTGGKLVARALNPAPSPGDDVASGAADLLSRWDDRSGRPGGDITVLTAAQAGMEEIEYLDQAADVFRAWGHERGGGLGRKAVAGQLAEVREILAEPHPAPLRRRLLTIASKLAIVAGHMAADAGRAPESRRYLFSALEAAREAGDGATGARAANAIARRIFEDGDPASALELASNARTTLPDLPGNMTAMLAMTEAWAWAHLGDYEAMMPCLDMAAGLAGQSQDALFGSAEIAGISGACFEILAIAAPRSGGSAYARRAERQITIALDLRHPMYVRSRALDLVGLANVRLCQREPAEAVRSATLALDAATRLRSPRLSRRIHQFAIRALEQFPQVREVPELAGTVRSRLPLT